MEPTRMSSSSIQGMPFDIYISFKLFTTPVGQYQRCFPKSRRRCRRRVDLCLSSINSVLITLSSRPVMFRATSIAPLFSWTGRHVPHPHANVIFADSFARGVVRSGTDYSVYEKAGLDGLDFAFYRGRSRYHTQYDSISGMQGSRKALWAMIEATYGASLALADDDTVHTQPSPRQARPVYFDRELSTIPFHQV